MIRSVLNCFGIVLVAVGVAQAPVISATKFTVHPTIDGRIEESEWSQAAQFEGLFDANTGRKAPESGHFWLGYDEKFIYFAARLSDSQPQSIKATEYRTNVSLPGDDTVELDVDLSGSMSDFSTFQVNPRGATNISIAGGRAIKREWSGEIVAQARTFATGWELEMQIPWKLLPLPKPGKRDVRFNVSRFIPRLNRQYSYVYVQPGSAQNTPIWQSVVVPKQPLDRSVKLLPYAYGGCSPDGAIANSGVDLKTSLTDQIQFAGTINPDFRNVENAILSLDYSRFARLAGETRPFFQEGSQYMDTAVFASQLIPRFDVGVNTYGKIDDKTQFGFIDTYGAGKTNDSILNSSYNPDVNDSYRISVTDKNQGSNDNNAFLVRYSRQLGPWSLFFREMGSRDTTIGGGDDKNISVNYYQNGLYVYGGYTRSSPNFNPALGFFPEKDYKGIGYAVNYERPSTHGPFQDTVIGFQGTDYNRYSGEPYRKEFTASGGLTFQNGLNLNGYVDRPTFEGSHDRINSVGLTYPATDPYRNINLNYASGEIGGSIYRNASVSSAYRPTRKLQLSLSYQRVHLDTDQDQTIFSTFYDLGGDRSISGRAVRSGNQTNFYVAYRRSGNRGAEYYLIVGDPNAATFSRSVILKVVFPFRV